MKENDEIAFWAKQKFNRNIERHSKHHPMISSLRQKADQKYIDILQKYEHKKMDHLSINHFKGVTQIDKLLYRADKIYNNFKYNFFNFRVKMRQTVIITNIKMENELKLNPTRTVAVDLNTISNKIKQKLISGFKLVAQIKPDPPRNSSILYRHYPLKPMIYTSFIANSYALFKYKTNLTNTKIVSYLFGSFALYKIIKFRTEVEKKYYEKYEQNESFIQDLTNNPKLYKKIADIYSKEEDEKYLQYLKEYNNSHNGFIGNRSTFKKMNLIKNIVPLGVLLYNIRNKKITNASIIPKVLLSYLIVNESMMYLLLGMRYIKNKNSTNDQIHFFKNNAQYAYIKINNK